MLYENILRQHSDNVKVSNFLHSKGSVGVWWHGGRRAHDKNQKLFIIGIIGERGWPDGLSRALYWYLLSQD